ncbi:MAG: hypothetical protein KHZ72_11125 [Lachnospiraceae bacterium]|nr:hypothetical protein [Lachnospiraceae bacterium]
MGKTSAGITSGKEDEMEEILIIDRNAVYELDEECLKRKIEDEKKKQEEKQRTDRGEREGEKT